LRVKHYQLGELVEKAFCSKTFGWNSSCWRNKVF